MRPRYCFVPSADLFDRSLWLVTIPLGFGWLTIKPYGLFSERYGMRRALRIGRVWIALVVPRKV